MWNLYHKSKNPSIVIIGNGREFGNKKSSLQPNRKDPPKCKETWAQHPSEIYSNKSDWRESGYRKMIREQEELLKKALRDRKTNKTLEGKIGSL